MVPPGSACFLFSSCLDHYFFPSCKFTVGACRVQDHFLRLHCGMSASTRLPPIIGRWLWPNRGISLLTRKTRVIKDARQPTGSEILPSERERVIRQVLDRAGIASMTSDQKRVRIRARYRGCLDEISVSKEKWRYKKRLSTALTRAGIPSYAAGPALGKVQVFYSGCGWRRLIKVKCLYDTFVQKRISFLSYTGYTRGGPCTTQIPS